MKKLTKITAVVLCMVLAVSLCACGKISTNVKTSKTYYKGQIAGTYAYVTANKNSVKKMKVEDFIKYLKENIEGKEYYSFIIDFKDGTGILFNRCDIYNPIYGTLDKNGALDGTKDVQAVDIYRLTSLEQLISF